MLLAQLDEHQAKAFAIIGRGDTLLAPDALPDVGQLSTARWELTRVLTAYQAFMQHELFDPIIRMGPPDRSRIATQMKAECAGVGEEYRGHLQRCANLDIPANWVTYRPAVVKLLAKIKAHMVRERWVTSSMLLQPDLVRA